MSRRDASIVVSMIVTATASAGVPALFLTADSDGATSVGIPGGPGSGDHAVVDLHADAS